MFYDAAPHVETWYIKDVSKIIVARNLLVLSERATTKI